MKLTKKQKTLLLIGIGLLLIYLCGVIIFSMNTLPNTYVNGQNRSFQSKKEIFEYREPDRTVHFQGLAGEDFHVRESDIDFTRHVQGAPALHQSAWAWPLAFFQRDEYNIAYDVTYDEQKLHFIVLDSPLNEEGTLPTDARIEVGDKGAEIVPEVRGTRIVPEKAAQHIVQAFTDGATDVTLDDIYIEPTLKKDDPQILAEKEQIDSILRSSVHFDFEDRQYDLAGKTLLGLYDRTEDGKYVFNDDRLATWVADIARETDTLGEYRNFEATGIGTIQVPPGIYGWQMDVATTVEEIKKKLEKEGDFEMIPAYNAYGGVRASNDIGDTYIEIDLSRQHLWAYIDGELYLESDIVSGVVDGKHETPVGVNCIWSMERDQTLTGTKTGDQPEYETPVKYWMPIDYKGVGMHDAPWRGAFGGDIYISAGSHGCINLPPSVAEEIFKAYETMTPVVVYESSTSYSKTE